MEHLKEISQKSQIRPSGAGFSLKKVHQGIFRYLLLKCTTTGDVFKRTCLIDAFILSPFLVGIFKAIFRWGRVKLQPRSFILIETCYSHQKRQIYRPSKVPKEKLLTSAVFITLLIKIYMILLPMEVCC